ncbi:MAG: TIGR00153 family protein [Candidatus Auribacterota bacterium]|nr:TIGR00153 family protein [Candidatus Auribacterota bacterium]
MLFDRKEKEVAQLFLDHFDRVAEALGHLRDLIISYLQQNHEFKDSSLLIHQSENAADRVKQEIEAKLYAGAFLPINRGDYIMLAEFIDRIANQAETTANLIVLTRPEIPEFLNDDLIELLDKGIAAFNAFKATLESMDKDIDEVHEAIIQVTTFETEADKIEWETIKKLFKSDLDLCRKLHIRELVEDVAFISDLAEDAAERLGVMVVKRPL